MKRNYIYLLMTSLLFFMSCQEDFIEIPLAEDSNAIANQLFLKEGVLKFESKGQFLNLFNLSKEKGAEQFYNENIKKLIEKSYKPLRPYFNDSETEQYQAFIKEKAMKTKKNGDTNKKASFVRTTPCGDIMQKTEDDNEVELDDEIIIDPNFAVLLNEEREVIVEGMLYRYTMNGVYTVPEDEISAFRIYLENQSNGSKVASKSNFQFTRMDYSSENTYSNDCDVVAGGGSSGGGISTPTPQDISVAKLSFETEEFRKNPSLWGSFWGYSRCVYLGIPDKKRIKLKFWNRNWVFFKSFGSEIRFQKSVRFLWMTGWQKSYADKLALGVNSLQYNYEEGAKQYFSSAVYNSVLYTYNGVNYHANGQISPYNAPKVSFPAAGLLGGTNDLNVFITVPFTDFEFEINMSAKEYANVINAASKAAIEQGIIANTPGWIGAEKPNKDSTLLLTKILRNGTSIGIHNKNWLCNVENNITKYFDVHVPTIKISADISGGSEQNYFSNVNVPFPTLYTSNYKTGAVDIYGGALYKGKWYGKRMVSTDFKRN